MSRLRKAFTWSEDDGDVLWWRFPITEAPYVGTPLDLGFNVSARLYNQFGEEIGVTGHNVGGWPFDDADMANLYWQPIEVPERPDQ